MDFNQRTSIITAAAAAAGPVADDSEWRASVTEKAIEIAVMCSDGSDVAKALESIGKAKVFVGHVVSVKKEASSTRGVVTLYTGTDREKDGVPAGCEQVRTDRTDAPLGLSMARKVRDLIGHRVVVWVEVEEYNGGQGKVRVLRHVESQGLSGEQIAQDALAAKQAKEPSSQAA